MNTIVQRCALIGAMSFAATSAFAHHPSTGGSTGTSGPINVISATTLEQGQGAAAVLFELIKLGALGNDSLETLAGNHIHAHSIDRIVSPSVVLAYGLLNDLTVSVRLPHVNREDIREGHHAHVHGVGAVNEVEERGNSSGIGDLTFLGQYRFLNNRGSGTEAALLLGIKTPTGRTNKIDVNGEIFEAEFQPGSGSWDGLFGLAFSQRLGAVSIHASGLYTLVTEGIQETDLGDRLHYGVAVSYRLGNAATQAPMYAGAHHQHGSHAHHEEAPTPDLAVDLILELNGEWSAKQEVGGVMDNNSGGHTLYISPGIRFAYDNLSAFASVGIPVVNDLNGFQSEPEWRLFTGVATAF
ncbi:MAG: transporter [Hyphomicrobiaceae bacterium]|nr:transporter [Hyphomicrobiaceae bacterium]